MYAWTHACMCMHTFMHICAQVHGIHMQIYTCILACHVSEYACAPYMRRCSFVGRLKKPLAAAVGSARTFFFPCSTRSYHGPLAVSLCVLYPALCPFSEARQQKQFIQIGKGPPPPASLQGHSSLGRILCYHGDLLPHPTPQSLTNNL